jgi:AraC-like DNA-binding protein
MKSVTVIKTGSLREPDESKQYVVLVYGIHKYAEQDGGRSTPDPAFMQRIETVIANKPYIIAQDRNNCVAVLSEIQEEIKQKLAGWQIILTDYCREYLIKLLRNVLPDNTGAPVPVNTIQANLAVEITKYMHEHYPENISLEDVSKTFHITPRHVTRIFSNYFGTSFRKTLSIYRFNYAKNYLCSTDKTVEEIAALVGISAPQTLYRLFKECEGMTISDYRKHHRQS